MPQVTVQDALQAAIAHHRANRLAEAEGVYREILAAFPDQPDALYLLGLLAHQVGRSDAAVELIGRAIALAPGQAARHVTLGDAYGVLGRLDEAIASYRQALAIQPDYAEAHNNLGNALQDQRQLEDAIVHYQRALTIRPDYAEAHNDLDAALEARGELDDAIACYRRAAALRADYLRACQRIDIGLDPIPYNGHTTSLDAFWMGVPVVTLVGRTVVGRAGLSQAMNLGLSELVAWQAEEYVRRAADLAGDLPRLAETRRTLRARMQASALMDGPRFARSVEAAFRLMWRDYCSSQAARRADAGGCHDQLRQRIRIDRRGRDGRQAHFSQWDDSRSGGHDGPADRLERACDAGHAGEGPGRARLPHHGRGQEPVAGREDQSHRDNPQ
jgi:tetratricopeptide (TPR) repeat protein